MTDRHAALDDALEQVITAARAHLAAVRAADGAADDERVWHSYVALNNASCEYDELLLDMYGEVTPWETETIDPDAGGRFLTGTEVLGPPAADPYPAVVSVRQRRDYRVPSVAALLRVAEVSARRVAGAEEVVGPDTVAEAVLELVQGGDGSLATLDIPALEPLDGLVTVTDVAEPLDLDAFAEDDGVGPFELGPDDRLVGRLDEHPYLDLDGNGDGDEL